MIVMRRQASNLFMMRRRLINSTQLRFQSTSRQVPPQQQQQQKKLSEEEIKRIVQQRKTTKTRARLIGATLGSAITLFLMYRMYDSYQVDPLNSFYDMIVRKIKGGPYRDYIQLDPSSDVVDGPLYRHADSEIQFSFLIPNKFIKPGVIVRDAIDYRGLGGNMEVFDYFGNYVSVDWVKLQEYDIHKLQDGRGDVLLDQANRILKGDKDQGYKVIWKQRAKKDTETGVPECLFFVLEDNKVHNFGKDYFKTQHPVDVTPSNSDVMGRLIFARDNSEHLIIITTKYPNAMINLDILRKALSKQGLTKEQIDKELNLANPKPGDNNAQIFHEMCQSASSDTNTLIEQLRDELISHALQNFKNGVCQIKTPSQV